MNSSVDKLPDYDSQDKIRGVGRQIYFSGRLERLIDTVTSLLQYDMYSNTSVYNRYQRSVSFLEIFMTPYIDTEYIDLINSTYDEFRGKNLEIEDHIQILDDKYAYLMKLMKRQGFLPLEDKRTNESLIVRNLLNRIRNELDAQVMVEGERGSGKSTLVLQLATLISDYLGYKFDVSKQVFTNSKDLRQYVKDNNPPPGTVLIWDEAGAGKGMGRRRAMTTQSIEYNEVIQIMRELSLIIFYTVPSTTQLDSNTTTMFTHSIETLRLDKFEKTCLVKFKERIGGNFTYPRDDLGNRFARVVIGKPPNRIIKEYKNAKKSFVLNKVDPNKPEDKLKEIRPKADVDKIISLIRSNYKNYLSKNKKSINHIDIYETFKGEGLTTTQSIFIKRKLEKELL